jgi:hypothetical protein
MTVRELIELLQKMSPDAEVQAWDPEEEEWAPVTGAAYDGGPSEDSWVRLYTDEP